MATATSTPRDAQFYRTRKMATFLPVVGVPFLAVMFYLGGGGTGTPAQAQNTESGFNTNLPKAEQASITSSKLEAYASPVDTLRNRGLVDARVDTATSNGLSYAVGVDGRPGPNGSVDRSVAEAQQQLIAAQQAQLNGGATNTTAQPATQPGALTPEEQMQLMRSEHERELSEARAQAQMAALLTQSSSAGAAAPRAVAATPKKKKPSTRLRAIDDDAVVSRLGSNGPRRRRTASFQGFDTETGASGDANTLPAVIHESQEVVSGSLVKMRLTESAVINGHQLPANTFIYGKCSLAGERLSIVIETLKSGNSVFPAALEVYDVDGLEGLHIPGAITRDAAKQAGAEGLGAADMMTMSAEPAMAAAGVAISAVKGIGQKKIRLVKVRLKAGYNVMLKVDKE
ncbi:conjugative transposon protein TraM [Hymenobacter cellulosilyticus]|uniref:Conjugative transposon protein TraM n=1 Tax=Hymenobacter cellulosilyticus TaxID=2932248 RepID=A0A8T9QCD6_9BACT|nr:conjugative transposon protein TraM [Hymenobacter cellulosilyticus]UOQ75167.1 conjugative transposon protein TraM [Hymenobacter cellulosilyticus]